MEGWCKKTLIKETLAASPTVSVSRKHGFAVFLINI